MSNEAKPENYDKPWPVSYGAPKPKELNAQFSSGEGLNKNPWPTSNKLANQVSGTKATVIGKQASVHPVMNQPTHTEWKKVSNDVVRENSKSKIF